MMAGGLVGIRRDELRGLADKADRASMAFASRDQAAYRLFLDLAHQCRIAELVLAALGEPAGATLTLTERDGAA